MINHVFLVFLTASKPSRRSITATKRKEKEKKGRGKKSTNWKAWRHTVTFSSQIFYFWACLCHIVVKHDAGGKQGKLLCCKRIFNRIKANLAKIPLKKHQNVQKTHFLQKVPGVNAGLEIKKLLGRLLATNWRILVARCKFQVASLCNQNNIWVLLVESVWYCSVWHRTHSD